MYGEYVTKTDPTGARRVARLKRYGYVQREKNGDGTRRAALKGSKSEPAPPLQVADLGE